MDGAAQTARVSDDPSCTGDCRPALRALRAAPARSDGLAASTSSLALACSLSVRPNRAIRIILSCFRRRSARLAAKPFCRHNDTVLQTDKNRREKQTPRRFYEEISFSLSLFSASHGSAWRHQPLDRSD